MSSPGVPSRRSRAAALSLLCGCRGEGSRCKPESCAQHEKPAGVWAVWAAAAANRAAAACTTAAAAAHAAMEEEKWLPRMTRSFMDLDSSTHSIDTKQFAEAMQKVRRGTDVGCTACSKRWLLLCCCGSHAAAVICAPPRPPGAAHL